MAGGQVVLIITAVRSRLSCYHHCHNYNNIIIIIVMILIIMTTTTLMIMMNRITVEYNCFFVTEKCCYALLIILQQNKHGMSTQPVQPIQLPNSSIWNPNIKRTVHPESIFSNPGTPACLKSMMQNMRRFSQSFNS